MSDFDGHAIDAAIDEYKAVNEQTIGAVEHRARSLNGYAPGGYMCKCCICGEQFTGDKRAVSCFYCAIAPVAAMTGWQPIETAPKDGTRILIFAGYGLGVMTGAWLERQGREAFAEIAGRNVDPTKWMPLPPPPEDTET